MKTVERCVGPRRWPAMRCWRCLPSFFACVVAYALSFRYVQDQAMEELVQQAEYIASCDVTDGTELSIPDEKTIEQYQSLTSSMVLYVDRDYLATHIGASNEPAPGGPEFARLEIISSIDRQFVARMFEGRNGGRTSAASTLPPGSSSLPARPCATRRAKWWAASSSPSRWRSCIS